jgi:hypothetical protein
MTPNWTKLAALGRMLFVLAGSTFFGALVIPLAADGSLPTTWTAWRPVLAIAGSAAVLAEIAWIRSHLAQVAQGLGLTPANAIATTAKIAVGALTCFFLTGCTSAGSLTPQGQTIISLSATALETTVCALGVVARDQSVTPVNYVQEVIDLAACGMDLSAIQNEFGATSPLGQAATANATIVAATVEQYRTNATNAKK